MVKFPTDPSKERVLRALSRLGFEWVREGNHLSLKRTNPDGTFTPLTMPNHTIIKMPTLRTILQQSGISRDAFLEAFYDD